MLKPKAKETTIFIVLTFVFMLFCFGCEEARLPDDLQSETDAELQKLIVYSQYSPVKIDILPLTGFVNSDVTGQPMINIYVSLLDSYGSQIKAPCVFRFELYQKFPRSAESKGTQVVIWPDMDLVEPVKNNQYWRNFLRAYEFSLPFEPQASQSYIIQVTCLCPNEKRLSTEFVLDLQSNSSG